jgi:uncharacterized protein Yka (UPF0111/DUF47 family)
VPFQVIPRDLVFYDLLEASADGVAAGAKELLALVDDLPHAGDHGATITELEQRGDDLTHTLIARLATTFVVPIDRHDIYQLASDLDDVLDSVDSVSDLLVLYGVVEPIPTFRPQVVALVRATKRVRKGVGKLRSISKVPKAVGDIRRQEREGDWLYRRAVASLYAGDYEPLEVMKWKDLLAGVESGVDRCEDIANTIETVAAKFA